MAKLVKTSIQLSPETIAWLDTWPGVTRSEAIRIALERVEYTNSLMTPIGELAETYKSILAPALEEFQCENFRTVARALAAIVGSYIQENDGCSATWKEEFSERPLDPGELFKKLETMNVSERMYLLDCIVDIRGRVSSIS